MSWAPFGRSFDSEAESEPAAAALAREPARRLAVVTCMDSRLDPLRDLGLARGDAIVLRNAGGTVSDDVERSLRVAQQRLGIREVWLVGHSDCVAHDMVESAVLDDLQSGIARLRGALPGVGVQALFYDLAAAAARRVGPAG